MSRRLREGGLMKRILIFLMVISFSPALLFADCNPYKIDPKIDPDSNEYIHKDVKVACEQKGGIWLHPSDMANFSGGCKFKTKGFINNKSYRWTSFSSDRRVRKIFELDNTSAYFIRLYTQLVKDNIVISTWEAISEDYQIVEEKRDFLKIALYNVKYEDVFSRVSSHFKDNKIFLEIEKMGENQIKVKILNPEILIPPFPLDTDTVILDKEDRFD